jgi:hypothetical protein
MLVSQQLIDDATTVQLPAYRAAVLKAKRQAPSEPKPGSFRRPRQIQTQAHLLWQRGVGIMMQLNTAYANQWLTQLTKAILGKSMISTRRPANGLPVITFDNI